MVRCTSCGLHYVRPRLRWDLILEGYEGGTDENFVSQVAFRERTFRALPGPHRGGGAAAGQARARRGRGRRLVPGRGARARLRAARLRAQHLDVRVRPGALRPRRCTRARSSTCRSPTGSVDLLTLWDVIEHTPDPQGRAAARARAAGARAACSPSSYPDYGSLAARAAGLALAVPAHRAPLLLRARHA